MTLGVEVRARTARVARGIPVDTGTLFVAGPSAGPAEPVLCASIGDFAANFGARSAGAPANTELYDYLDGYFGEGGKRAYVQGVGAAGVLADELAKFDVDLGPGQVAAVQAAPVEGAHDEVIAAAKATDRVALLDTNSDDTDAELDTIATAVRAAADNDRAMVCAPWAEIPPPAGTVGAQARQIPASAIVAGLCAKVDSLGNPNRAAAGRDFPLQYVDGLTATFSKATREDLFEAGVNLLVERYGVLQNYGFNTARAANDDDPYLQFSAARTRMYIEAQAKALGEPFAFRPLDALNHTAMQLRGSLEGMLLGLYAVDALYGLTPQEAFAVEVGASVNTEATVVAGELHAVCEVRFTKYAQAVIIDLVTVPLSGSVSTG
jgi:hypothetical protein